MLDCQCKKCNYVWKSKVKKPKQCPKCKNYRWDEELKKELGL